jgi:hypothetical protein
MSLYFAFSKNISLRNSVPIFIIKDQKVSIKDECGVTYDLFPYLKEDVMLINDLLSYSNVHSLPSFEILVNEKFELEKIVKFLSSYLLDKDMSIGLISDDINYSNLNRELLISLGVTLASNKVVKKRVIRKAKPFKEELDGLNLYSMLTLDSVVNRKKDISINRCYSPSISKAREKPESIKLDKSFSELFMDYLIESGKDNVEVYTASGISRQVFSNLLKMDAKPSKNTIICLCIGLELTLEDSKKLLESAGYALSKSILLDAVISKYLRKEIYDIDEINSELNERNLPLLGWNPK